MTLCHAFVTEIVTQSGYIWGDELAVIFFYTKTVFREKEYSRVPFNYILTIYTAVRNFFSDELAVISLCVTLCHAIVTQSDLTYGRKDC